MMQGFGVDGYFAEYAVIDYHNACVLPRELDPVAAAPLFCAGVTAFHAIDDLKLEPESWVAIIGCGGLGLLGVQYARAMNYRVIAIDTASNALEVAKEAGAEHIFNPVDTPGYVAEIMTLTGRGVHAAVNFTASKRAYSGMPAILRPGQGIFMAVGIPPQDIELSVFDIALGKYKVMGANNGHCHNTRPCIEFSAKHGIISKIEYFSLEELPEMVKRMQNHTSTGRMAVKF